MTREVIYMNRLETLKLDDSKVETYKSNGNNSNGHSLNGSVRLQPLVEAGLVDERRKLQSIIAAKLDDKKDKLKRRAGTALNRIVGTKKDQNIEEVRVIHEQAEADLADTLAQSDEPVELMSKLQKAHKPKEIVLTPEQLYSTRGIDGKRDELNGLAQLASLRNSGDCLHLGNIDARTLDSLPERIRNQILTGRHSLVIDRGGDSWVVPRQRMSPANQMRSPNLEQSKVLSIKMEGGK